MKRIFELHPLNTQTQKSFYNKALVIFNDDKSEILLSYNTPIIQRFPDGSLKKIWNGWSVTTGKHIKAFCGLNKKEFEALN